MTDNQRPVVQKIIETFKSQLSDSVRTQISDAQFDDLAQMIDGAINQEVGAAAEQIEEVVKKLRASSRGPELGL